MVAKNDAKSAFIASYFGDENDDFSAFTRYHLIVDALHDEIAVSEIFSRIVADPRFRMFYDLGNFGKSESKIGFDVNLDFLNLKISGKLSIGNIKVIDVLNLEAEKYFAEFEYSHDSTQLRKKNEIAAAKIRFSIILKLKLQSYGLKAKNLLQALTFSDQNI